ncbi:YfhO family protein [Tenacibaculum sp. M341]|uniref:YfhO family protein n=1 Tax=Tenacibaculum sp. M341 TaxID=2530339 RepID=UPI0010487585|nr:YfhO family protein [Tenacibaculum sp. M341]TCI90311.1 hypothetical protein EYW44_13830 [Tenacibaculum sp. M341]
MKINKFLPYVGALILFVIASLLYFNPVLSGKQIKQSDITQYIGMAKEMNDFRKEKKEEPYWVGNAFSGMPSYQLGARFPNDFVKQIDYGLRFLPRPADYLFLYFVGFFLLLTALKVDWKLAILGSLSFGFSTYLIIIFGAGHNAKAHAIAYMPAVLAGVLYVFQKRYLLGFIVTSLAMALEICANHIQMTYYLGFCLLILGIVEAIEAFKNKQLPTFAKQVALLLVAFIIGIGTNATRLLSTKEYANFSTRGSSELTINSDGSQKEKVSGLDKSYITEYSYGISETFNLFIPRFMGGGTVEKLGEDSEFYKTLAQNANPKVAREYSSQVLTYWGTQPIVEAPAYIGAIIIFLFFLGAFLVDGKLKYWLVATTIFSILLSWGKNFAPLTNFFIDYVPLYNKFRAVSSIQVIAELCIPVLAILGLKSFFFGEKTNEIKFKSLKLAVFITGGIALFFMVFGGSLFAFEGIRDGQYDQLPELVDALRYDRKSMLFYDSLRSLVLILLSAGALWAYLNQKLKLVPVIFGLGALILFDLLSVDLKYVNEEDFTSARKVNKPFVANEADKQILKDKTHYRVANFTANLMNEGRTSYFHKSIGGYHAAKMMRYQELFEYAIGDELSGVIGILNQRDSIAYKLEQADFGVLNMLNTKYFILSDADVLENKKANGNAWFVNALKLANTANEEILALQTLNTKKEAVVSKSTYKGTTTFENDTLATISLKDYKPNHITYESNTTSNQFAVFSEVYYKDGWNAYIDGKLTPYYQVDYVLRGMEVPAGKHTIEFKFEPQVIQQASIISLVFFVLMIIIPIGWFIFNKKKTQTTES